MKIHSSLPCLRLLAAAMACLSLPLVAVPPTARSLPVLMPAPETALRHAAELELTAEQRAKLEEGMADLQTALQKFSTDVQQQSDTLAEILAAEKPDEGAVAAQLERVLAAEAEVKRVRLTMSLRTRAALTPEQARKLQTLQNTRDSQRPAAPADQDLAVKMERVKSLIERARQQGVDLSSVREMWRRVNQLTQEGKTSEAGQVLDETATGIESKLTAAPGTPPTTPNPARRR